MIPGTKTGKCDSCGAALIWALTPKGKWMPLDAEPNPKGNIVLNTIGLAVVAVNHATCPNASDHRKAKR